MTITDGFNIVDGALMLAVSDLERRGMPQDEAYVALLIRLWNMVPAEVAEVASMLRDDPELAAAINNEAGATQNETLTAS